MHMVAGTKTAARDETKIRQNDIKIGPSNYLKSLGVWIYHRLTFKRHTAHTSSHARGSTAALWKITKSKGVSPGSLHHLVTRAAIPGFTWGSEIRWTGARHVIDQVTPAYNGMVRLITGLPQWTPLRHLLIEAGLPPLHLYLDMLSRRYRTRILCSKDNHPCKATLLQAIRDRGPHSRNGTGLSRIADLLATLITRPDLIEDPTDVS